MKNIDNSLSIHIKRGDIVLLDLNPTLGHEQKGRRPAVVLSHDLHNQKTGMAIICPVTSYIKNYPFEVEIDTKEVKGAVLANQVRTIDISARNVKVVGQVSLEIILEILRKFKLVIE